MDFDSQILRKTLSTPYGEKAYAVVEKLMDNGFEAWWVGGCVRDMLQEHIPDDIDIATNAQPEDVLALFEHSKEVPNALGSTRVRMGSYVFEVTSFRKESKESDGRTPQSIVYTDSKEEDAVRRDFTINALYVHPVSYELYDPFDGALDLQEKLIRFIGNPQERIEHDALRILRAVRFCASIEGQYHPDTYKALRDHADKTASLSGTRILEELQKLLFTARAERGLEDLWELSVLEHMVPELYACKGVAQPAEFHHEGDVWNHLLQCVASFEEEHLADVRLAALFHDIGKVETFSRKERIRFDDHARVSAATTKAILERLQMPAKRIEKICWLIEHHMMMGAFTDAKHIMEEDRKAHWYFHPWFLELLQLFWLDIKGTTPSHFDLYDAIVQDYHSFVDKHPRPIQPLLDGKDIMRITGLKPGPHIGELSEKLVEAQMGGSVTLKKEAEEFVKKLAAEY